MSGWTDERVELMRKLWDEGLSASLIAGKLGGTTRNAVIGKVHRLGIQRGRLPRREGMIRPTRRVEKPMSAKGKRVLTPLIVKQLRRLSAEMREAEQTQPLPLLPIAPISGREEALTGVALLELERHHCRWPIGDPRDADFRFCGKPKMFGSSYCPDCRARAYTKPYRTGKRFVMRRAA
jgi:GcrA cell cycle regulator